MRKPKRIGAARLSGLGSLSVYVLVSRPSMQITFDGNPVFNGITSWGDPWLVG